MRRKIIFSLILIVVLIGVGALGSFLLVVTKPVPPMAESDRPPIFVESITVRPQTVVEKILGYGTARADRYARISAQVSGEVVEIAELLKPGSYFKKGQLLLVIDDRDYQEQLKRAEGLLAASQAQLAQLDVEERSIDLLVESAETELASLTWEFQRIERLYKRNMGQKAEYEGARRFLERARRELEQLKNRKALLPTQRAQLSATCRNHEADVELARLSLERCRVVMPFDGQVDELTVEIGERVMVGALLVSILDPDLIEVPIELPVSVRGRVQVGAACSLSSGNMNGTSWSGHTKRISPSASELTRQFKLYVEVKNAEQANRLMPGYFVQATIEGDTLENVLTVPRGVVQNDHVFVFQGDAHGVGAVQRREVRVVRHLVDQSIVTGLQSGDVVITSNLDALFEGADVRVAEMLPDDGVRTASSVLPEILADKK